MITKFSFDEPPIKSNKIEFQEKFDPHLISGLYKNFKDPSTAILELIDNAIDDRIPGKVLVITIDIHGRKISVINKGGKGMGPTELRTFFTWGQSDKKGKLGRYGQGGKAAMGYLGKSWRISSTKAGEKDEYIFEEDDWDDRSSGMKSYKPIIQPARLIEDGVVQIDIWNLKKKIHKPELAGELSAVYRPLIKSEDIRIIINGKRIAPSTMHLEMSEDNFSFNLGRSINVSGWLSILVPGDKLRGGIRCYEYGRLISEKEFFGPKDPTYKESLNRLIGEMYIDFELPLLMNKTDFDRGSDEWGKIKEEMQTKLEPYIEVLLEDPDKDVPTEKEKKSIVYAGDVWKQFLNYLNYYQKEGNLPGLPIDIGQKPPERRENNTPKTEITHEEKEERKPYIPATPPPLDKVGKRKRTGSYLKPVLKPLHETIRYEIGKEDGEKVIFINTRFSGFKLRKNQLPLYTWETQIVEYAKAEDTSEQSVEEYIEEMNDMLKALGDFIKSKKIKINP